MKKSLRTFWIRSFYIFTIFLVFDAFGQDVPSKKLLNEVSAKVKSYNNIAIDFTYIVNAIKNQESKGNVTLEGNRYVLNLLGITKIFDGKKIYVINPEDEEISISNYNENDDYLMTPSRMLTFFNSGFKSSMGIVKKIKGRNIQFVKLISISDKAAKKNIVIGVDLQSKNIYSIEETIKNGAKTTIIITSFQTNQPMSKNQFTFVESKYPKYYINKLD